MCFRVLLHDVGKPVTFSKDKGKITFYKHEHIGADMTESILSRLKFSNREIRDITAGVENHMKFAHVQAMRVGKLKQFMSRDTFENELELHRMDCLASHKKLDNYYFLKAKQEEFQKEELKPKPVMNGHDLIRLGISAGPKMKEILNELYTLQLEGEISSLAEAKQYVRKHFLNKRKQSPKE